MISSVQLDVVSERPQRLVRYTEGSENRGPSTHTHRERERAESWRGFHHMKSKD
jgi:hypothetical protein